MYCNEAGRCVLCGIRTAVSGSIRKMGAQATGDQWGSAGYFCSKLTSTPSGDPFFDYEHNALQRRRIELTARFAGEYVPAGSSVLDVGCATGELTAAIHRRVGSRETVAVDFVPELLELARGRHAGIRFERAVLPRLPFGAGQFDAVVCAEVLYYLSHEDRLECLRECRRVLRPSGIAVIAANAGGGAYLDRRNSAVEFESAGWRVVALRDAYLGLPSRFLRGMRALERRGGRSVPLFPKVHVAAVRSVGLARCLEVLGRAVPPAGRSHRFWALEPIPSEGLG